VGPGYLASGARDGAIQFRDAVTGASWTQEGSPRHPGPVTALTYNDADRVAGAHNYLASGSADGTLHVWRAADGVWLRRAQGLLGLSCMVARHGVSGYYICGSTEGSLERWSAATDAKSRPYPTDGQPITALVLCASENRLVAAGSTSVRVWNEITGEALPSLSTANQRVLCVAACEGAPLLAAGDAKGVLHLWNALDGAPIRTLEGHLGEVWGVAFDDAGTRLVSAGNDGTVRVWDLATGASTLIILATMNDE
jgi:hypothetical protein